MSARGGDGPVTTVVFVRSGTEVARTEVPGHLLELDLPRSVELRRLAPGYAHLVESPDPLYECAGRLSLPWVNRSGPGLSTLDVPPPFPFTNDDVTTMWHARNRLVATRRPPTSGHADWSRLRVVFEDRVDWRALEGAVVAAGALLGAWPTRPRPAVNWLPVDRAGGRVLVGVTERAARSHRSPAAGPRVPAATARRTTSSQERTLHALSAISALLASRIMAVPALATEPDIRDRLAGLFRRVAVRSNPPRPVADPPPSAWPDRFAGAYSACLRALSVVEDAGPGRDSAPLSELWELYQAWTGQSLLDALEAVLGASEPVAASNSCIGRWPDAGGTVELHYQPLIPTARSVTLLGCKYLAALGDLVPDLLLVRRDSGATHAVTLDAKKRSSAMTGDDLTTQASKYLWGIRLSDKPDQVPAVERAVMLAPLGGPAAGTAHGLAEVYTAHPSAGIGPRLAPALLDLVRRTQAPHQGNASHLVRH